jgi:hypothetical protein
VKQHDLRVHRIVPVWNPTSAVCEGGGQVKVNRFAQATTLVAGVAVVMLATHLTLAGDANVVVEVRESTFKIVSPLGQDLVARDRLCETLRRLVPNPQTAQLYARLEKTLSIDDAMRSLNAIEDCGYHQIALIAEATSEPNDISGRPEWH